MAPGLRHPLWGRSVGFSPGVSAPGIYTYTVAGTAPCGNAISTVNVTVNAEAHAGSDASQSVCSTGAVLNMFPLLGGTATRWHMDSAVDGCPTYAATFSPTTDVTDVFAYTVQGLLGCANDVAFVSITLNQAPNAGFNGLVTVCDSDDPFQLVNQLNGSPQLNGTWVNPSSVAHTGIYVPGVNPPGVYTYTVAGTAPCANAQAQVTVIQNAAPDAGENGVISVCSNNEAFPLFNELSGTPGPGGSWTGPSGSPVGSTFTPGISTPGVYEYRIQGVAPCSSDSATVTVLVNIAPNAGIHRYADLLHIRPVSLITLLGGTPGPGGSWTFDGDPHGPIFNPATDIRRGICVFRDRHFALCGCRGPGTDHAGDGTERWYQWKYSCLSLVIRPFNWQRAWADRLMLVARGAMMTIPGS